MKSILGIPAAYSTAIEQLFCTFLLLFSVFLLYCVSKRKRLLTFPFLVLSAASPTVPHSLPGSQITPVYLRLISRFGDFGSVELQFMDEEECEIPCNSMNKLQIGSDCLKKKKM